MYFSLSKLIYTQVILLPVQYTVGMCKQIMFVIFYEVIDW